MKIVQICSYCGYGSVGKICQAVSELLTKENVENYILYSRKSSDYPLAIRYSKYPSAKIEALKSRICGNYGFNSHGDTIRLIRQLDSIKPDIVHIHNIHSHDCDFAELFNYLRLNRIKIFYTFHDCWAFTGYCTYFDAVNCNNWETHCSKCPLFHNYSWFFDRSSVLFQRKRDALREQDLTIVTPSQWLANLTKRSFLKDYPVKVINNGINLNVFRPYESDFKENNRCTDKFVILGVAMSWEPRKGLQTFIQLSRELGNRYQIVLVGTNEKDDKLLPSNIISIHRTKTQKELAEIYSAADVLVNPTMEENFPTVNIESLACGTPIITYNTGGSAEIIDEKTGIVIERGNYESLREAIISYSKHPYLKGEDCVHRSLLFSQDDKYKEYLALYYQ